MSDYKKSVLTHHFSGYGSALLLGHHRALGHPLGDALRGFDVLVLGLPHDGLLRPARRPSWLPC